MGRDRAVAAGAAASTQGWASVGAYRNVLAGIVYVLRTGVPWRYVPARELGCGSGVTCWRRLVEWQQAGVWEQLHQRLLDRANTSGGLDWSVASLDSTSVRAKRGGRGCCCWRVR